MARQRPVRLRQVHQRGLIVAAEVKYERLVNPDTGTVTTVPEPIAGVLKEYGYKVEGSKPPVKK